MTICQSGFYDEDVVRNEAVKIQIFDAFILFFRNNGSQEKRLFPNYKTCDILKFVNKNGG